QQGGLMSAFFATVRLMIYGIPTMAIINAFSKFHKAFLDARACRLLGTAQPLGVRLPIAQDAAHDGEQRADEHQMQHHAELGTGKRSGNSKARARLDDARNRLSPEPA